MNYGCALVRSRGSLVFAALAAILPMWAGSNSSSPLGTFVVVGDSLGAGFQNFSLNVTGQPNGYAAVVAGQAGASFPLPLVSYPGIPPALTLTTSGQLVRAMGIGAREIPVVQTHDLSVPGFTLANAIEYPYPGSPTTNPIDAMSDTVLAMPGNELGCGPIPTLSGLAVSEMVCALALRPNTILVDLGNNDALQALTFGLPPTSTQTFAEEYNLLLAALSLSGAKIFVANIPNVTDIPFLVPVPYFQDACPSPQPPLPSTVTNADYVVVNITNTSAVSLNICSDYAVRPAALVASAAQAVTSYNAIISSAANRFGATVVDFNGLLNGLAQSGYEVNGKLLTTQYLGGLFSLDAIHPTNTGYAILANTVIQTMNQRLHSSIPQISVSEVAATDPLFPLAP